MKLNNLLLKKCSSLSKQLGRSSSYSSLRTNSVKDRYTMHQERIEVEDADEQHQRDGEIIYVGSSRRRYVITAKYLSHPVLNALIEKSSSAKSPGSPVDIHIKCEVVLFEHLLWMLDNATAASDFSLDELADLTFSDEVKKEFVTQYTDVSFLQFTAW